MHRLSQALEKREEEFSEIIPLTFVFYILSSSHYLITLSFSIFSGTWNVNGKKPTESLKDWLSPSDSIDSPDIYALGYV